MTTNCSELAPSATGRVPFTVIDEFIHHLDTPSEPWSIEVEVAVDGRLDDDRLRQAVGRALAHHPMARVRRLPARRSDATYTWEVMPGAEVDPMTVLQCDDDQGLAAARDRLVSLGVPLAEAPPLRLRLVHRPDGDLVVLNANHAAFDGFGCIRLLQSVGRAYARVPDPLPDVDLAEARDVERWLATDDLHVLGARIATIARKVLDVWRAPARLASDGGTDEAGYRIVHRTLSADAAGMLDRLDHPGTLNDLLMAGLHLAVESWNRSHGRRCGRVSVLMPVNLRPKEWRHEVVTNFVLMARVVTEPADRRDPAAALAAVTAQTEEAKRLGTGASLIEVLKRSARLPLWARQPISSLLWLTGNRLIDTALFSNMGHVSDPPAFGADAGPTTGMWFSAPARLPCGLALGAVGTGHRLHLSFRWRRPIVGADGAGRFADCYARELARLAGMEADRLWERGGPEATAQGEVGPPAAGEGTSR